MTVNVELLSRNISDAGRFAIVLFVSQYLLKLAGPDRGGYKMDNIPTQSSLLIQLHVVIKHRVLQTELKHVFVFFLSLLGDVRDN